MTASLRYSRSSHSVRELTQTGEGEQRYELRAFLQAPIITRNFLGEVGSFYSVETGIKLEVPPGFYVRVVSPGSMQHPPAFRIFEAILTPKDTEPLIITVLESSPAKISNGDVIAHLIICEYPKCFVTPTN